MLCINVATILARVANSKHTSITSSRDLHEASKLCDNVEYNLVVVTVTSDSSFEVDEEYWPRATGESLKLMYNMSRRWCWLSIFLDVECPQRASTRRFGPGSESLYEASKASREVRTVGFRCKSSKIQSHLQTRWTEANWIILYKMYALMPAAGIYGKHRYLERRCRFCFNRPFLWYCLCWILVSGLFSNNKGSLE